MLNDREKVGYVMSMVLGDYLAVFVEGQDTSDEDIKVFAEGCEIICKQFGITLANLDVDGIAREYLKGEC